ncbi:MAG TPA: TerC family protein [Hyphomonadaceae bacterium]|nr:TerC family protein [Hyphomonadaceae bacterium]
MDLSGFMELFTLQGVEAFFTVVMIDLVLAGDNAVVIGMAAAGLPKYQRGKAILIGVIAATVLRICFALIATQLLAVIGLLFAGGVLLLWVCWKMWRELRQHTHDYDEEKVHAAEEKAEQEAAAAKSKGSKRGKSLASAVMQIVIADVSMSLDNVLAVAGAAHEHPWVLVFGLALSVLLMGAAATLIARLLHKYRWIAYVGLIIILYVAGHMRWDGGRQIYDCNPGWFGRDELGPECKFVQPPQSPA